MLDEKDHETIQEMMDGQKKEILAVMDAQKAELVEAMAAQKAEIFEAMDAQKAELYDAMAKLREDLLRDMTAAMRVLIESSITPQFKLLAENQQIMMETLTPKARTEELEDELDVLRGAVRQHSADIAALKKAVHM
jgi:uncharacterized membrane-anchored protein YhcB (DUF1043 family)